MAGVKGWDNLANSTRTRYERRGVTREMYASGTSLKAARGHSKTPEHRPWKARGIQKGIAELVEDFAFLPRDEQERLSQAWVEGFHKKGKGEIVNPKRKRGERIRRRTSEAQEGFKMDIRNYMREVHKGEFDESEIWKFFRESYGKKYS